MRNIILCGFMGSGKTTLAKKLSAHYDMPLVDTDEEIVKREGRSIADIFSNEGEPYFRALETELIRELSKKENMVIALGGGLAANERNHPYLKEAGKVVLLECSIEETLKRILGDDTRPLTAEGEQSIVERYNKRKPIYEAVADIVVDSSGDSERTFNLAVTALEELL